MFINLFLESTCIDLSVQYQDELPNILCGTDIDSCLFENIRISTAETVLKYTE